jgi:D-galacturonate reductase
LCDIDGNRLPQARELMKKSIGEVYKEMDTSLECFPDDHIWDESASIKAMETMNPGDCVIIFTPDPTHFEIASAAMSFKLHVLVAKPIVKSLQDHQRLELQSNNEQVLCAVEYHKRWDPIYNDAKERAKKLGRFSYFYSCMTQRREQLDTFRSWAGKSSDISYYLNSHHIDIHCWFLENSGSKPVQVVVASSKGLANERLESDGIEDTITLIVTWENIDFTTGHAVYMSSWIAPTADCHTQQSFHYVGHEGEIRVDQAHRGYKCSGWRYGWSCCHQPPVHEVCVFLIYSYAFYTNIHMLDAYVCLLLLFLIIMQHYHSFYRCCCCE